MRDPKNALHHLRKASAAIKAGDGSTARHHIGHALVNTKQGFTTMTENDQSDGDAPMSKNWIAGAIKKPGALHQELGVPQGEKIPAKKIAAAADSDNPTLARRANLAKTLRGFNKKK